MYEMQVKVYDHIADCKVWKSVRPTRGVPYRYNTSREALEMLDMCYGDPGNGLTSEDVRIIEV